jgi:hypothetical protein
MRRSAFRLALALFSIAPLTVLACGDDTDESTPTTNDDASTTEDGAGRDASGASDAPVSPIDSGDASEAGATTISVQLKDQQITTGFAVFYPKNDLANPMVEPIVSGQTVTKSMPSGAHVIVAWRRGSFGSITQIDDVQPGETVELTELSIFTDPSPLPVVSTIPVFTAAPGELLVWASCMGGNLIVPGTSTTSLDHRCVEANNKARFLTFAYDGPGAFEAKAIGTVFADIVTDGGESFAAMQSWTTPSPVSMTFTGSSPGATSYFYSVAATNTGTFGGFNLTNYGAEGAPPGTRTFRRPGGNFNDGEVHVVGASLPLDADAGAFTGTAMLIDRTAPTAALAYDFGTLGPHFTRGSVTTTDAVSASLGFTASSALPVGSTCTAIAVGTPSGDGGAPNLAWHTVTSAKANGQIPGLALPESVRAITGSAVSWRVENITCVGGIDGADLRQHPTARALGLRSLYNGDFGLPPGTFQAKVARLERQID